VHFAGAIGDAMRACLWSRIAMRVLLPLAEFPAADAEALYVGARDVRWEEYVDPTRTFAVEAVGRTAALGHTHFTALKVKDAVADALRERRGARPDVSVDDPDVRIVAHLARGRASLAIDLAGEPLFKRGWRLAQTEATLKETLAAAILRACGYDGTRPLIDPMCGSGTLAIEAALIAQNPASIASSASNVGALSTSPFAPNSGACATRPAAGCAEGPPRSSRATVTPRPFGRRRSTSSAPACRSRCGRRTRASSHPSTPRGSSSSIRRGGGASRGADDAG
jgi:hypothetical protein